MKLLNPYIKFNDNKCRVAMNFYKSIFGGELEFMTLGDSPMAKDFPDGKDKIMHSTLKGPNFEFYGSDMMRDVAKIGDHMGISINTDTEEELNTIFNKLAQGGDVFMKPEDAYWGAIFAMVTDKYGVEWMLNFQKTPMKK